LCWRRSAFLRAPIAASLYGRAFGLGSKLHLASARTLVIQAPLPHRKAGEACLDRPASHREPACQSAWRIVQLPAPLLNRAIRVQRTAFPARCARTASGLAGRTLPWLGITPVPLRGSPAFGIVQVSFFDAAGKDHGTVDTVGQPFPARTSAPLGMSSPANTWTLLDTGVATAPAGSAFIETFTLHLDFSGNHQRVLFDDLDLRILGVPHAA
jgi:hypothetical protein